MSLKVSFALLDIAGHVVADDGSKVSLVTVTEAGDQVSLGIPADKLAAVISALIEARALALAKNGSVKESLKVQALKEWSVGVTPMVGQVVFVLDNGSPGMKASACSPKTARELGKALVAQAREAEREASRQTRN